MTIEAPINVIKSKLKAGRTITPPDISPVIRHWRHIDAYPERYEKLSKLLGGQSSPEDLQEIIDVADIVYGEKKLKTAKVYSVVNTAVESMNRLFSESIDLPPTGEKILCGATSNIDSVSFLRDNETAQKKIDKALEDAFIEGTQFGKSHQQVTEEIETIINVDKEINSELLPKTVTTKAEVIGFILRMFQHSEERGRLIADLDNQPGSGKKLTEWIRDVFQPELTKVGGAAAQMADLLTGMGEDNVVVYTQHNSQSQVYVYKNAPKFLQIVDGKLSVGNIKEAANENDPTKINYPVERAAGISVTFNGKNIIAINKADRFIFLSEYYDINGKIVYFDPLLKFSDQDLKKIGREFKYFFTTGPNYLQRLPKEKYGDISKKMADQLKILKSSGVKILYEFSGSSTGVKFFADVLRGNITSFSMNDDKELKDVIVSIKAELDPNIEVDDGDGPYAIYKNAVSLANYLGVERLHIHGKNSDIVVRKNASEKDLETEVRALMHTKQRVTEWIQGKPSLQKTPPDDKPSRLLRREGFVDLLQLAGDLSENLFAQMTPSKDILKARAQLILDIIKKGYHRNEEGYSVAIIPVKWIYDEANVRVTTSAGDISIVAAIHSGI